MDDVANRRGPPDAPADVLVVDDDDALRGELAMALQVCGFRVATAVSAEAALATFAERPDIAVLLTDIRMPGRSGIALAQEVLARRPPERALEVVLLSGHIAATNAVDATRVGAFDLLAKPARLADIVAVVTRAMDSAQRRRRNAEAGG